MIRLTKQAHEFIRPVLIPGCFILDATAGNGYDTCFLAREGTGAACLIAVDCQDMAVANTQRRLCEEGLTGDVRQIGHGDLVSVLGEWFPKGIDGAMFNLGYLPRGDQSITTRAETTLPLLQKTWSLLLPSGRLSILAYRGHPGGATETAAVTDWALNLGILAHITRKESPLPGPVLMGIEKLPEKFP